MTGAGRKIFRRKAGTHFAGIRPENESDRVCGIGLWVSLVSRTDTLVCPVRYRHRACGQARVPVLTKAWQRNSQNCSFGRSGAKTPERNAAFLLRLRFLRQDEKARPTTLETL